jgi:hypothetical protein
MRVEECGRAPGLRLMRRVQVVEALEELRGEIREAAREAVPHGGPARVAQAPVRVEDRRAEVLVPGRVDAMLGNRPYEGADSGRARRHPRGRLARRRRRQLDAGRDLQAEEGGHGLGPGQRFGGRDLLEVRIRAVLLGEVGGGLVDREREQPFRMGGCEGERAGAASRVAVEMEAGEARPVGRRGDARDLHVDRVARRRLVACVHLEVLEDRVAAAQLLEQRPVAPGGGRDDAREEEHVRHYTLTGMRSSRGLSTKCSDATARYRR